MPRKEVAHMAKRQVEVFTAGCPVCEPAVQLVKELACPDCEVTVHELGGTDGRLLFESVISSLVRA